MPMQTVEGVYENGAIRLTGAAPDVQQAQVLVTFLNSATVDLPSLGIGREQAAELRARLTAFAEDWNQPDMDAYDRL